MGCASTSSNPLLLSPPVGQDEETFISDYMRALSLKSSAPQEACVQFLKLTQTPFILASAARVRALETCDENAVIPSETTSSRWLKGIENDVRLARAQKAGRFDEVSGLWLQKGKASNRIEEKTAAYLAGIEANRKGGNDPALHKELETRLLQIAPRFIPNPSDQQLLAVAKDWMQARDFEKARKLFRRIIQEPQFSFAQKHQARLEVRNSYKLQGLMDKHVEESGRAFKWLKLHNDTQKTFDAGLFWARATWTQGKTDAAKEILLQLKKDYNRQDLSELEWVLGRMSDEAEKHADALAHFQKAGSQLKQGHKLYETVHSAQAWTLRKLKRYEEAAAVYEMLTKSAVENQRFRFLFWQAKSLVDSGRDARPLFDQLMSEDSLGYYGILAHLETQTQLPPLQRLQDWSLSPEIPLETVRLADRLWRVGERDMLYQFLLSQHSENLSPNAEFFFLKSFARAGFYQQLFREIGKLENGERRRFFLNFPDLVFPRDYLPIIENQAQKFRVPTEFTLAIIRQESAFSPVARSRADAFGLMQVLPSVAKNMAKKYSIPYQGFEDLYEPATNVSIGMAFLSDLFRVYGDQIILVAARYNANPKSLSRWVKQRYKGDTLEFIEDIPFSETQTYVKLILRNTVFYERLKNEERSTPVPKQYFALDDQVISKIF